VIAVGAIAIGLLVGGLLGLAAGYFRGKTDAVLSPTFNALLAFPQLVLALAVGLGLPWLVHRTRRPPEESSS
jgi:peptide/nickel transport system permease protein